MQNYIILSPSPPPARKWEQNSILVVVSELDLYIYNNTAVAIAFIIITYIGFHMFRPPKPSSKPNKLFPALHLNPTCTPPLTQLVSTSNKHLKMIVRNGHRSTSKETAKCTLNAATRKTQDSQTILYENHQIKSISPKNQLLELIDNSDKLIPPPSLFKIRQLSSQSKRFKENIEPNTNKSVQIRTPRLLQDCTPKEFLFEEPTHSLDKQSGTLIAHPLQNSLQFICSKTGSITLNKYEKTDNSVCFIISECVFQQSLAEESAILKLKNICQQLHILCPQPLVVLKLFGHKAAAIRGQIEEYRIKINCLVWDQQTTISSVSVYNLSKLASQQKIGNFVILSEMSSPMLDLYFCGVGSQYIYVKVNGEQGLIKLINSFNIVFTNKIVVGESQTNLKTDVTINYSKHSSIINQTTEIVNNNRIIQLIRMGQGKRKMFKEKKVTHCRSKSALKQIQKEEANQSNTQFEQIYKNKLVKLVKLLNSESSGTNNLYTNNNAHYIKLIPHQKLSQVMECMISTNTPFQIAGEIVKNNGFNYEQIKQFRDLLKSKLL